MEIQAYYERCLPGQPDEWAEPGKPFVGTLTLESPTDADDAACCRGLARELRPFISAWAARRFLLPPEIVEMIVAACAQLNQRLLICTGPNDLAEFDRFDHVKFVSAVNHATILPGCQVGPYIMAARAPPQRPCAPVCHC